MFMETLPLSAQWAIVTGFFMPLIIAVINRSHWRPDFKAVVGFLACVAATCVQLGIEGKLDAKNFFPTFILVFASSITAFKGLWKPTGIANGLEDLTTPGALAVEHEEADE